MEFEKKILSKEIQHLIYEKGLTIGTAESCTGGRVAEAIIATPGSSAYFKGSVVAYTEEIKERLLGVSAETMAQQTAVCEDVARQMVTGALKTLNVDFAISTTGTAGPSGGTPEIPVGTIYVACGNKDEIEVEKLTENYCRDINLDIATSRALQLCIKFIKTHLQEEK